MRPEQHLLRGPALAAVLKLLEQGPRTARQLLVQLRSDCPAALVQGEASLLALLFYLEAHQFIMSQWTITSRGRRKTYWLTHHGRHRLSIEVGHWQALASLLNNKADLAGQAEREATS